MSGAGGARAGVLAVKEPAGAALGELALLVRIEVDGHVEVASPEAPWDDVVAIDAALAALEAAHLRQARAVVM